jgi:hypothetical protein
MQSSDSLTIADLGDGLLERIDVIMIQYAMPVFGRK